MPPFLQQKISGYRQGQKEQDKYIRIKIHDTSTPGTSGYTRAESSIHPFR